MESEKELTRDFSETVKERAARDPEYLSELMLELHRLHALVQASYIEGFHEGRLIEHPMASAEYAWDRSTTKKELNK